MNAAVQTSDVTIIIVTYNSEDEIQDCLQSIYESKESISVDILIIDNLSQDKTTEIIKQNFPEVRLIEPGKNLGFAAGVNAVFPAGGPALDPDAYTLVDLSVVWEDDDGHWRAGLHGKNLTDEHYKVAGYFFPTLGLESSITAFYGNPRQITATVEYRW